MYPGLTIQGHRVPYTAMEMANLHQHHYPQLHSQPVGAQIMLRQVGSDGSLGSTTTIGGAELGPSSLRLNYRLP
jgi:hypothetical protein